MEDRLKYAYYGQIKEEKQAQIITGQVQDAILRKEGAIAINEIYREIVDIMKKVLLFKLFKLFINILFRMLCILMQL